MNANSCIIAIRIKTVAKTLHGIKFSPRQAIFVLRSFLRDKIFTTAIKIAISAMQCLTQEYKVTDKKFANESRWQNW